MPLLFIFLFSVALKSGLETSLKTVSDLNLSLSHYQVWIKKVSKLVDSSFIFFLMSFIKLIGLSKTYMIIGIHKGNE